MKTFKNPEDSVPINQFTYEGCRYEGIAPGMSFSVLSDGLVEFLKNMFPQLIELTEVAPVADNEYCCSKCNKDCGSKYMKERHEKVCKAAPAGLATILKPSYIFWNYVGLDKTQLTEDQFIPASLNQTPTPQQIKMSEKDLAEPAEGKTGTAMIGKTLQPVTTDRDGIDWYGPGLEDDPVH